MQNKNYQIRTMNRKEVDIVIEWAAKEGWNLGLHDADCFYSADPKGFFVGLLDDEPIAVISAVKYGESFGFLGLYIVKPEYRGQGYGIQIWDVGLKYLKGRNIGLDGVVAQQDNYKKSGFKSAHRNIRYKGCGGDNSLQSEEVVNLSTLAFENIASYDRLFFPEERMQFLKSWINQADTNALGVTQNGKLAGFGVMCKCLFGYKIGPLYADSPELTEMLFQSLKSNVSKGQVFYLDTPDVNSAAVQLAERNNMEVCI